MMFLPLYIDPGTGSMLFSLFIGLAAAATFGLKALFVKLRFILSGGKASEVVSDSIPYVIFSDHKRYWNVFKPICDEFEQRGIDLVYYTASPDDPVLCAEYKHVKAEYLGEKSKPYAKLNFLTADILIATTPNLDVYQWKRSKGVKYYVHIPHSADELSFYRMFGLDYYDAVLTTGKNQQDFIRKIESLRPAVKPKELYSAGSLTLDNLKRKLDSAEKIQNEQKIVLVAPSWGKSGILSKYGEKFLTALSKTEYKIVVRPHPQTVVSEQNILAPLQEKFSDLEWNYDNDNFNIMNKADLMITDFSSIIQDFSLVYNKPVIYADTEMDTMPYDADWLDEKPWQIKTLSLIGKELREEDFDRIGEVIKSAIENKNLDAARDKVRSECWENIGFSAKAAVDWIINKHKDFV